MHNALRVSYDSNYWYAVMSSQSKVPQERRYEKALYPESFTQSRTRYQYYPTTTRISTKLEAATNMQRQISQWSHFSCSFQSEINIKLAR